MPSYNVKNKDLEDGYFRNQYPEKIDGYFYCADTDLISLKGSPSEYVRANFICDSTRIVSLEGAPKIVKGSFNCNKTKITSLNFAPLIVGEARFSYNHITSLEGIGRKYFKECISGILAGFQCPIKSNILGLMLVKGLTGFYSNLDDEIQDIIHKHLIGNKDVLELQEELLEKGFKQYAKL